MENATTRVMVVLVLEPTNKLDQTADADDAEYEVTRSLRDYRPCDLWKVVQSFSKELKDDLE